MSTKSAVRLCQVDRVGSDGIRLSLSRKDKLLLKGGAVAIVGCPIALLIGAVALRPGSLGLLVAFGLFVMLPIIAILWRKSRRWPGWMSTEILVEPGGITVTGRDGGKQTASWAKLADVNFEYGEFSFGDGTRITVPPSLREYGLMANVTGSGSPLAWAWRSYLAAPSSLPIDCARMPRPDTGRSTAAQEVWCRKEGDREPIAVSGDGQIRLCRSASERRLFLACACYAIAFLPVAYQLEPQGMLLQSCGLPPHVGVALCMALLVPLLMMLQRLSGGVPLRYREMSVDTTGVSLLGYSGKHEHRSWDDLRAVDFRRGVLVFANRRRVRLFGPLAMDKSLLVEFAANERVTKAWRDYWARPRLDAGLVPCAGE